MNTIQLITKLVNSRQTMVDRAKSIINEYPNDESLHHALSCQDAWFDIYPEGVEDRYSKPVEDAIEGYEPFFEVFEFSIWAEAALSLGRTALVDEFIRIQVEGL